LTKKKKDLKGKIRMHIINCKLDILIRVLAEDDKSKFLISLIFLLKDFEL